MDLLEFKKRLRKRYGISIYVNYAFALMAVLAAITLFVRQPASSIQTPVLYKLTLSGFLIIMAVYAINVTHNIDCPTIWSNLLSKKQNTILLDLLMQHYDRKTSHSDPDYQQFIYKRKWWQMDFSVHAFAGDKMIAIKADSQRGGPGGIVDLGAAHRFQQKVMQVLKALAEEKFPDQEYKSI